MLIKPTRRISLEKDFFNRRIDDLLYAQMACLATAKPINDGYNGYKLYLTKQDYAKNKSIFYGLGSIIDNKAPAKVLNNHLKILQAEGLVQEEIIEVNGKLTPSYTFPYNYDERYFIIQRDMLRYIVDTRNRYGVQIYIYLANAMKMIENTHGKDLYTFTKKDLVKILGFSEKTKEMYTTVGNILDSFKREGIIDWVNYYETHITSNGQVVPVPKMRLTKVIINYDALPSIEDKKETSAAAPYNFKDYLNNIMDKEESFYF